MPHTGEIFDDFAKYYDAYRPLYPSEIVDDLIQWTEMQGGVKVLEVGAGTGQLTRSLLDSEVSITAIEPGSKLAAILRKNLESHKVKVKEISLEDLDARKKYDVVVSAQAFHWIDYTTGLDKIFRITSPKGRLGILWRIDKSENTAFYKKTKSIYARYYPEKSLPKSMKENVSDFISVVKSRDDFSIQVDKRYEIRKFFTPEEYLGLLATYSGVIGLPEDRRQEFLDEVKTTILHLGGSVERIFEMVLLVVRKNKRSTL